MIDNLFLHAQWGSFHNVVSSNLFSALPFDFLQLNLEKRTSKIVLFKSAVVTQPCKLQT